MKFYNALSKLQSMVVDYLFVDQLLDAVNRLLRSIGKPSSPRHVPVVVWVSLDIVNHCNCDQFRIPLNKWIERAIDEKFATDIQIGET